MFEIGKRYTIEMSEGGDSLASFSFRVDAIDGPLIKENEETLKDSPTGKPYKSPERIINTNSVHFVSAEKSKFN